MKQILFGILTTLLATGVSWADEKGSVIASLTAVYEQASRAFENKDLDKSLVIYDAATYRYQDAKGETQTLAKYREDWRAQMPLFRNIHVEFKIQDVQGSAGQLRVQYQQRITLELDGKALKHPGLWIPLTLARAGDDTWQHQGGTWRVVKTHVLQEQQTIDQQWLAKQTQQYGDALKEMRQTNRDFQHSLNCMQGIGYGCSSSY